MDFIAEWEIPFSHMTFAGLYSLLALKRIFINNSYEWTEVIKLYSIGEVLIITENKFISGLKIGNILFRL